jgi:hypothetical protein
LSGLARLTGCIRWSGRRRRGLKERQGSTRLTGHAGHARLRRLTGSARAHSVRPDRTAPEDRHHDEPAVGELVVADDGIAVVAGFARPAETLEDVVR